MFGILIVLQIYGVPICYTLFMINKCVKQYFYYHYHTNVSRRFSDVMHELLM